MGFALLISAQTAHGADRTDYVFASWQAGTVGNCVITDKHVTAACNAAPQADGWVPPDSFIEKYLNGMVIPNAPAGKRITVLLKLREPATGLPPDVADSATTELHLKDLQRQFYPRAAMAAKLNGQASADCTVLENGKLDNCWITSEAPTNAGFGEATLKVINLMQLTSPLPSDLKRSFAMTWQPPGPPDQVFVNCNISPEYLTSDCKTDAEPDYPGAAQAVLNSLSNKPLHLPGAPVGQRVEIALIRSELSKAQVAGTQGAATAPYKPVHLNALNAQDVLYYYPPISIRLAETGYTDVKCKVTDDGRLNECWVANNSAKFDRLGHAHLRLTELVRMQPPTADSPAYDSRQYAFRISWSLSN
jgi:TonB family protein